MSPALGSRQRGLAVASAKSGVDWGEACTSGWGDRSRGSVREKVCTVFWALPCDKRVVVPFPRHGHAAAVTGGVPICGMARPRSGSGGSLSLWVQREEGLHRQREETRVATAVAGRRNNPNKRTHQKSLTSVLRRETAEIT